MHYNRKCFIIVIVVDNAKDEGKQINWLVNVAGAKLVCIGTDYVFDMTNLNEYQVDDLTNLKNKYGKAKLAGER